VAAAFLVAFLAVAVVVDSLVIIVPKANGRTVLPPLDAAAFAAAVAAAAVAAAAVAVDIFVIILPRADGRIFLPRRVALPVPVDD